MFAVDGYRFGEWSIVDAGARISTLIKQDQQADDVTFTDDEIRQRLQTELENYWGTAWGEAEMTAYLNIVNLVLDPESTQRHRVTG